MTSVVSWGLYLSKCKECVEYYSLVGCNELSYVC